MSAIFRDLQLDPKVDYKLIERLAIQQVILERIGAIYRKAGNVFISDRTPIDMLAYMLADVQRSNVPAQVEKYVEAYMKDCFALANEHFSTLVLVQPGVPIADEEGKAPATFAYMEHINSLCLGLMVNEKITASHYMIPRLMTGFEQRITQLDLSVKKSIERFQEHRKNIESSGVRFH